MEAEAGILVRFALCALVEVLLQGVREPGLVLADDFWVVGHVAQRVVVVKCLVSPREGDAVGTLVVGERGGAVALGVLVDLFFGSILERVMMTGGETGEARQGQDERQYRFFHGLLLCPKGYFDGSDV